MVTARCISRDVTIATQPATVFALLADPREHPAFDGSGTVQGRVAGPERLHLGAQFAMRMHLWAPYVIRNTVVEYVDGSRIAWRHFGHHRWRFELTPVEGGTRVTESFDWSTAHTPRLYELLRIPQRNARSIEQTLPRLKQLAEARAAAGDAH